MNIFILDKDIKFAAQYHCNKHIVKMPTETAQLLSFCHYRYNTHNTDWMYKSNKRHLNHPCTLWLCESLDNYIWLCQFGIELCKEYTYRYNKRHKTQDKIERFAQFYPNGLLSIGLTNPALAMPEECRIYNSDLFTQTVESYRNYYCTKKRHIAIWKNRETPEWYINDEYAYNYYIHNNLCD